MREQGGLSAHRVGAPRERNSCGHSRRNGTQTCAIGPAGAETLLPRQALLSSRPLHPETQRPARAPLLRRRLICGVEFRRGGYRLSLLNPLGRRQDRIPRSVRALHPRPARLRLRRQRQPRLHPQRRSQPLLPAKQSGLCPDAPRVVARRRACQSRRLFCRDGRL